MYKNNGVNADKLRARTKRQVIKTICDDLVKIIDAGIASANDNGFHSHRAELPTMFNIIGMDLKDAQIVIYSELIRIYDDKQLDVTIEFGDNITYLYIQWQSSLTQDERVARLQLIRDHMRPKNK